MISHNLQGVAFYHVTQDLLTNQLLLGNAQDTPATLRLVTERELTNVEHLAGVHLCQNHLVPYHNLQGVWQRCGTVEGTRYNQTRSRTENWMNCTKSHYESLQQFGHNPFTIRVSTKLWVARSDWVPLVLRPSTERISLVPRPRVGRGLGTRLLKGSDPYTHWVNPSIIPKPHGNEARLILA